MANQPLTLKDIMNPEFQVRQAKYENARGAVVAAYNHATKMAPYEDWDGYFKAVDIIHARYLADLNKTLELLDDTNGTSKSKAEPPTVSRTT